MNRLSRLVVLFRIFVFAAFFGTAFAGLAQAQPTPSEIDKLLGSGSVERSGFGSSIDIDGDTAVIGEYTFGAFQPAVPFAAYVFTRENGAWTEQQRLPSTGTNPDYFGARVAIEGDTILAGGLGDEGEVLVYERNGNTWTQTATLTSSDNALGDNFGISVALSGDTALIGAAGDDDAGNGSGSAYVFVRNGNVWTQQAKLTASSPAALALFGAFLELEGDTALIGAYDFLDSGPGAAYVFTRDGTTWSEQARLTASDGAIGDLFGAGLALEGDTAIVGAPSDDDSGDRSGASYVFIRSGTVWTEQQKLLPADGAEGDFFGAFAALQGDTLLISASADDDDGDASGSVYRFTRIGGVWTEAGKLTARDAEPLDGFGIAVALEGDTIIIGAQGDDDIADVSGAAYVFSLSGDVDGDGIPGNLDNCPTVANPDQLDANADGFGDACVSVTGFISNNAVIGPGLILGTQSRIIGPVMAGENLKVGAFSWLLGPSMLGSNVSIGDRVGLLPGASVGDNSSIGDRSVLLPNADIGSDTTLGARVRVLPLAIVGNGVTVGNNVIISVRATIGDGAIIGNNVRIGPGASIAPGAVVPDGTRIRPRQSFP